MNKLRNILLIGWLIRYWSVIVGLILCIYIYNAGMLGVTLRGALLIPIFLLMVLTSGSFATNLMIRGVTGSFRRDDEKFLSAFNACTPFQKILICKVEKWLVYIIAGVIAASTLILININVLPIG